MTGREESEGQMSALSLFPTALWVTVLRGKTKMPETRGSRRVLDLFEE